MFFSKYKFMVEIHGYYNNSKFNIMYLEYINFEKILRTLNWHYCSSIHISSDQNIVKII